MPRPWVIKPTISSPGIGWQQRAMPQNRSKDNGRVVVEGVGNLMHHIARCCQPIPGDEIVGFITQGRGISISRCRAPG